MTNTGLRVVDKFKIVDEPHAAAWLSECTQALSTNRIQGLRAWARLEHMSLFAYILLRMQTFVMERLKLKNFIESAAHRTFQHVSETVEHCWPTRKGTKHWSNERNEGVGLIIIIVVVVVVIIIIIVCNSSSFLITMIKIWTYLSDVRLQPFRLFR